jgi:diguanylate cyclase (GGDEF)-like protein
VIHQEMQVIHQRNKLMIILLVAFLLFNFAINFSGNLLFIFSQLMMVLVILAPLLWLSRTKKLIKQMMYYSTLLIFVMIWISFRQSPSLKSLIFVFFGLIFMSLYQKISVIVLSSLLTMGMFVDAALNYSEIVYSYKGAAPSDVLFFLTLTILISAVLIVISYSGEKMRRSLEQASVKDYLTGLHNYRSFDSLFDQFVQKTDLSNEMISLILLDIDHFKRINDSYGHSAGDAILTQLSGILTTSCRRVDIVSRTGGEEFSILLPNCSHELALEIGERIRASVQKHTFDLPNHNSVSLTVSIGVSTSPQTPIDILKIEADNAMYKAKHSGRNSVRSNMFDSI